MVAEEKQAIEKLALFFYFCFMDEGRAQAATEKAIKAMREYSSKESWNSRLVRASKKIIYKQKDFGTVSHIGFVQGQIEFPEGSNWGPWFEFRKQSEVDSFTSVIWVKILGIDAAEVAQGLDVTEGTVRFRLSHALRSMGQIIRGEVAQ